MEKRTKVKSRVMANAFGELVSDASSIFVMGHKYADLDTVGSATASAASPENEENARTSSSTRPRLSRKGFSCG
jgi:c-di-AMP phosphodiesterase-like protein